MEKQLKVWRAVAILALCAVIVVGVLYGLGVGWKKQADTKKNASGNDVLTLWSADSNSRQSLISFVEASVKENGSGYIPEEDRIAVFDMDGTLTCETFFTYYDTMMFIEYCLKDHPERVSDELKAVASSIKPGYVADETLARNFAKAYAGLTVEEFYKYVEEFGQKFTKSFNNMRYIDGFYLPMVELVDYLYNNGYEIWVISGTERTTTRAIVANSPINAYVKPEHVIGTDFEIKQKGHEDESSNMNFKYENGDELVLTGGFIQKNLNANKSIYVEREIGQRPVLAFGNSGSDTSMMNYAIDSRNPNPAQAYMIVADDSEREWGKQNWEEKSADYIKKGFVPISMKNDFVKIYPDGITKASEQYQEDSAANASSAAAAQASDVKLSDDSSDFVLLSEAVPDAILEIRYYSTYNFVGDRIDGYEEPLAMLTKEAAKALKDASDELVQKGYRLKIFDAYRPQMAVTNFMNWALDSNDTRMKKYFYPELEKDVLFPQGYIAEHSGHSRGSTLDLTLFDMNTEREVDMGGTFDYFGELSHPDYTNITKEQYDMRMLLRDVMTRHGFKPLEEEWWHFTLENEPYPDTYFTFPINSDSLQKKAA